MYVNSAVIKTSSNNRQNVPFLNPQTMNNIMSTCVCLVCVFVYLTMFEFKCWHLSLGGCPIMEQGVFFLFFFYDHPSHKENIHVCVHMYDECLTAE